jgi:VWFA-related protein
MKRLQRFHLVLLSLVLIVGFTFTSETTPAQSQTISGASSAGVPGKPMTIPVTIRLKEKTQSESELQNIDLTISEDGDPQTLISIRAMVTNAPITLALLIQEDLVPSVSNEIKPLAEFVRKLPRGSRVMVGYLRAGSLQVRQKFTTDLEKAAKALRPPIGFANAGPYNPYVEVIEAIRRFESQPAGRRAILLVSDGLDISRGIDSSSPSQSIDLQRAINEAQRRSIAVYGFYAPTLSAESSPILAGNAQSSLLRLSTETGGHAFFQGTGAPVSFDPFIRQLDQTLEKQVALTFLSTHLKKGFHRLEVRSSTPGVRIAFPSGYMR